MYYSSGNYEAFARPRKPKGVDEKSAYIVGAGLAGLAAAAFLVRDGQMDGRRITIFDAAKLPGGAMDGIKHSETGYRIRGDREQEDHMECLWDLMRSIPSIEVEGASVLDEFYWLNKEDPTYSLRRATRNRGEPIPMADKMTLSPQALRELATLAITRDEDLYDKRVSDVVGQEFLDSNFWLFFKTMFAMIPCHSALELKLYLNRFVHVISGMHDLAGITFTRYNQYEVLHRPVGQMVGGARGHLRVRHPGHQRAFRHHGRAQGGPPHRMAHRREARCARPYRERPGLHDHRLSGRELLLGRSAHAGQVRHRDSGGQHLGTMAQHRQAASLFRPAGQVLHQHP